MEWHTDNKLAKKAGNEFKEIPGIIFIIYLKERFIFGYDIMYHQFEKG